MKIRQLFVTVAVALAASVHAQQITTGDEQLQRIVQADRDDNELAATPGEYDRDITAGNVQFVQSVGQPAVALRLSLARTEVVNPSWRQSIRSWLQGKVARRHGTATLLNYDGVMALDSHQLNGSEVTLVFHPYPGTVFRTKADLLPGQDFKSIDLALVRMRHPEYIHKYGLLPVNLGAVTVTPQSYRYIETFATGFDADTGRLHSSAGNLGLYFAEPGQLKCKLATTNLVRQGMSGGPVTLGPVVIGIAANMIGGAGKREGTLSTPAEIVTARLDRIGGSKIIVNPEFTRKLLRDWTRAHPECGLTPS